MKESAEEAALEVAKQYMRLPAYRNDLRFFLNYIDVNMQFDHFEEARRVAQGTLGLLPRLGVSAQRWKASVLRRLIQMRMEEACERCVVAVDARRETVKFIAEETVAELTRTMCDVLNEQKQDLGQLDRRLMYLLTLEGDQLKATEYAEANGVSVRDD